MQLIEVNDRKSKAEFIQVNVMMNRHNPAYIQPLDNEVNDVFDPNKNKAFIHGEAIRWILKDINGKLIGRIAAFVSSKYVNKDDTFPAGTCGFFDCINDQQSANLLFDTARKWLVEKGMEAMDGPVNFGERDKWWGLMVEGFEQEPMYGISFNPAYYEQLFEGYGFQNFYNQYYYQIMVAAKLSDKFEERYNRFVAKKDYTTSHVEKSNLKKYAKDFSTIYNSAWAQHEGGKEISYDAAVRLFEKMKPIMDEKLVWFAYYKEEPIGMWINIPDINQYFKYLHGKFGLLQKLKMLWLKFTKPSRKMNGVAFGIVPKFQALGIDAFVIFSGALVIKETHRYDLMEMGWAGDWNPKMIGIYKSIGATESRRMVTYRYNFDRSLPFERHPIIQ